MTIAISCSHCGQRYAVDPRAAGKTVTCQACGQKFVAKAIAEEDELTLAPEPEAPKPAPKPAPQAARPAGPVARAAAPQPGVQPARPGAASASAVAGAFGGMSTPPRQGPTDLSDLLDDNVNVAKSDDDDLLGGHGAPAPAKKKKKKKKKKSGGAAVRGNEAGLGQRFFGNMIDGMYITGAAYAGLFLFTPTDTVGPMKDPTGPLTGIIGVILVAIGVQAALITTKGQSIGKMAMGTQIANVDDNDPPGFMRGVVVRWWLNTVLCLIIPFYGLIDAIMIFGEESRCLHDQIAGTRVISI